MNRQKPPQAGIFFSETNVLLFEEVYRQDYRNIGEAKRLIGRFVEQVYNEQRLHSAFGYRPPAEFERALLAPAALPTAV